LDEGDDGRLMTSAGVVENRREIFILKKEFLRATAQMPPLLFDVANVAETWVV
jgi:hypothetical protein